MEESSITTLAYRDGILAVDRQASHGSSIRPTDMKIRLIKTRQGIDYALAFTGALTMGLAFEEWVKEGQRPGEFPIKDMDTHKYFHALLVKRNGSDKPTIQYFGNDLIGLSEDEIEYTAQGTGDEFAYGAFFMNATAVEAVQAANVQCAWSGFGVLYVDVKGDFEIKRWKEKERFHR